MNKSFYPQPITKNTVVRDREINYHMIYHAIPNHQSITNKSCCGYFIWKHRGSRVANSGWFLETENLPQAGPSGQGRVALSLSSPVTGTHELDETTGKS